MPELPEVETIRRDLDRELANRRIAGVDVSGQRSIRRHPDPAEFAAALVGGTVDGVARRGKYLLITIDTGSVLVIHLGMSGQLLVAAADDPLAAHTHVTLRFGDDRELRFVDPRTFGEVFVASPAESRPGESRPPGESSPAVSRPAGSGPAESRPAESRPAESGPAESRPGGSRPGESRPGESRPGAALSELAHLGPDPLSGLNGPAQLAEMLHARRAKLKPLLMDQRFLAGIGNLYSDEILFAARVRYDRSSETLTVAEVRRLYRAMTGVLESAIQHRGSSLADEQYRDVFGAIGGFQSHHQVYGREGRPCPKCRRAIVRIKTGGRSTFLCPRCQA